MDPKRQKLQKSVKIEKQCFLMFGVNLSAPNLKCSVDAGTSFDTPGVPYKRYQVFSVSFKFFLSLAP